MEVFFDYLLWILKSVEHELLGVRRRKALSLFGQISLHSGCCTFATSCVETQTVAYFFYMLYLSIL
jgi:hypothetical protein